VPEVRPTVLRSRMVRALSNVICNALEASPVTQVSLAVELDPGAVCFLIEDDGCGMTEDQLAAATRCFTTNKRAVGGTGMGLAIVQRVVEGEHRGRLELAGAVDEGTRVRVVLPMAQGEGGSEGVG
jgi:signal transduction histidine kinase